MSSNFTEALVVLAEVCKQVGKDSSYMNLEDWLRHVQLCQSQYDSRFISTLERIMDAMTTHTLPIVGAYYRPPSKLLLDNIAVGAEMQLHADPGGAYCHANHDDPNAISVWLNTSAIPANEHLNFCLASYGSSVAELQLNEWFHVGYIPKELAAELVRTGFPSDASVPAEFSVGSRGSPRVRFEL
jgi:hypothetical protein